MLESCLLLHLVVLTLYLPNAYISQLIKYTGGFVALYLMRQVQELGPSVSGCGLERLIPNL